MRCRFGCSEEANPAVVVIALGAGCIARPDDHEQAVCLHHAMRSTPLGTIDAVRLVNADPWERGILQRRYPEVAMLTPTVERGAQEAG